jgi:DNA-binding MarR family transcriptional regulator
VTIIEARTGFATKNTSEDQLAKPLSRTLIHAFYWMDDGLQNYMLDQAGFSLPRAQSMMMICIGDGIRRQRDIAKHLRITKQAVRQSIKELESKELIVIDPDPHDGRQKVLRFTRKGEQMREIARGGLARIEQVLSQRIGRSNIDELHQLLELDWGAVPTAKDLANTTERKERNGE